jgi:hypothetical protein
VTYTAAEKASEAEREVAQRRRVYARLVDQGKMTADAMVRKIAIMDEIAADYRALAQKDRLL